MGAKTEISWTDATWNPVRGCSMAKGSETGGCLNCYAARMASRNLPEMRSPSTGKQFARILPSGPRWTGEVELIEKALTLPIGWRKPRKVFVNSMSDLWHEALTDEMIDRVFAVMALCLRHVFQVLTKRPERMRAYFSSDPIERIWLAMGAVAGHCTEIPLLPLHNVWLGVSVEDQKTVDARTAILRKIPAAVRFVSQEPQLGPINWTSEMLSGIHWLIVGGESGPGARPFDIAWARSTVEQCRDAGVACFVKQLGAKPVRPAISKAYSGTPIPLLLKDRKGGNMEEWPEDLRVRQFPQVAA